MGVNILNNNKKSGFISLIGRPSSGKSTLINTICGYKISIVSDRPQTTQFLIRGIYNDKESQIIFIDTPGYHHFDSKLNRNLSKLSVKSLEEGDLILYLVDLTRDFGEEEESIIEKMKSTELQVIVAYNKVDICDEEKSKAVKSKIKLGLNSKTTLDISAKTGEGVDKLLKIIKKFLPYGPNYYPEEFVTDQSIPFRIKEVTREKVFNNTIEELPHSVYVEVDSLDVKDEKIISRATIFVERNSQKGIVIGKEGSMIKKIGEEARLELQDIFERKVNLFLNVKLHKNWRKDEKFIKKRFYLD